MVNKYKAKKVKDGGHTFDSQLEYRRWCQLKLLERAKEITDLAVHPVFQITVEGKFICKVIGDFEYIDGATNQWIVEDCKGIDLPISKLKRKLVTACYPSVEWRIVRKA